MENEQNLISFSLAAIVFVANVPPGVAGETAGLGGSVGLYAIAHAARW